jgi:hypothetical protein
MKTATLNWKLLPCLAGVALVAGCMMDPPGPAPIYSRLPDTQPAPQETPTPQQQMDRYNAIDRQALNESQQSAAAGNAAKTMSQFYAPMPVSVYGGYSSGGWGGPSWGTGVGFGTGW